MNNLSAIIITLNEENNLGRCLKALEGVADEIIVVDSFSTDRTEAICIEHGVTFFQRKFDGYGSQKRYATDKATHNYVLSVDADEVLSDELRRSILVEKKVWSAPCYSFNIRNHYCGKPIRFCGWYPDRHVRIFNKQLTNWTNSDVHESILVSSRNDIKWLKGDLLHYTCTSMEQHQQKEKKYAQMNAAILIQKGAKIGFILPYIKGGFRFFKTYILKLGILDGYYGFVISATYALSSYMKYKIARDQMRKSVNINKSNH